MTAPAEGQAPAVPRVNRALWLTGRTLMIPLLRLGLRYRASGREHLPRRGGLLIVANHRSLRDPPVVGYAATPRLVHYMAKHTLFRSRALAWLIRGLGAFPVVRESADRNAIRTARALLEAGHAVVMFPEGTRGSAPDGTMLPVHPGAALLALVPGVRVVPVALWDSRRRFGPLRVRFGPPIDLGDLDAAPRSERLRIAGERMVAAIGAELDRLRAAEAAGR